MTSASGSRKAKATMTGWPVIFYSVSAVLLDVAGEIADDAGDVRAERREGRDERERDERHCHRVLGKLQPGFVPKEIGEHGRCSRGGGRGRAGRVRVGGCAPRVWSRRRRF